MLDRTQKELKQVVYQKLSSQQQENYNQAQSYWKRANEALNDRNLPQASAAAEKAAQLVAAVIGKR